MVWDTNPNQFVVEACSKLRPGRALDLGAGEGRNALWLAGRGWTVTAVDFANIAVGRISSRAALQGLSVDAIVDDALTYHPKPASFDLVVLSYLQLPMPALRKVLGNVAVGLSVAGRLVLVAHDATNIEFGHGGPKDPDVLHDAEAVAKAATAAGLEVVRAEVVRREVQTDLGVRIALDHVVEALRPAA